MSRATERHWSKADLERVRGYYCSPRDADDADRSIYEIWEAGDAFKDSVTPSTYVPEYRRHIVDKIVALTEPHASVLSLGCGNGVVEQDLVGAERDVTAVDCNDEAVALTRDKGVSAFTADYYDLQRSDVATRDVLYADGLLGHLFDPQLALGPALQHLAGLGLRSGAWLVLSNDAPPDRSVEFASHPSVEGFTYISKEFLREALAAAGFEPVEDYYYSYVRPLSGERRRTICTARAR